MVNRFVEELIPARERDNSRIVKPDVVTEDIKTWESSARTTLVQSALDWQLASTPKIMKGAPERTPIPGFKKALLREILLLSEGKTTFQIHKEATTNFLLKRREN